MVCGFRRSRREFRGYEEEFRRFFDLFRQTEEGFRQHQLLFRQSPLILELIKLGVRYFHKIKNIQLTNIHGLIYH